MCDPGDLPGASAVGAMVKGELLREWHAQVVEDHLTRDGLVELRSRLDPVRREFDCPVSRALLILVIERLAPLRGLASPEQDSMWAELVPPVPDMPGDLGDGPPPRW
jgi:hypothetical protein